MIPHNRRSSIKILTLTFLPHFTGTLAQCVTGPLAPFLQEAFQITRAQIGLLTSVQSIGLIAMATVSGSIVERFGIKFSIFLSQAIAGVCALLLAYYGTYTAAVVLFIIIGFAFSIINPATTKAIIAFFPQTRRGTAIAIKQSGVPAGVLLASLSLPAVAVSFGWEKSMYAVALIVIAGAIAGWYLYGNESSPDRGKARRQQSMRDNFKVLFKNRNFLLTSGLQGIFCMVQFIIRAYLVLYLVEANNYSVLFAGFTLGLVQFSGMVSRLLWGLLSDYTFSGKRLPVLQIIGLVTVAGLLGLAFLKPTTPTWFVWIVACVAGAGAEGFAGTAILLRAELAGKGLVAVSTGLGMAIAFWGVLVGPPLFGMIVDMFESYRLAWVLLAVISVAGVVALRLVDEVTYDTKLEIERNKCTSEVVD